ncbi:hypothetical protein FOZ62_009246, partial [Perkinsus olseni]
GHVFVYERDCGEDHGGSHCHSTDSSGAWSVHCYTAFDSSRPSEKVEDFLNSIEAVSQLTPNGSKFLTNEAHWQYNLDQFEGVRLASSSLLMDEYFSRLNHFLLDRIDKLANINMLQVENVCDHGLELNAKLEERATVLGRQYPKGKGYSRPPVFSIPFLFVVPFLLSRWLVISMKPPVPPALTGLASSMIPLSLVGCLLITLSAASVDDIPLNHYPMIMSHDAGMGYTEDSLQNIVRWSKNQVGHLKQQVDCGARAFDMRGACGDDGVVRIHHGIFVIDVPLRKALEDLIAAAGERPEELLLVQYQQYLPDTEECRREVWKVSEELGLMKSLGGGGDSCEKLRGLTVGEAKDYGKLANGGHIFVFEAGENCTLGRGNLNCYTKPDDSQTFESC